MQPCTPRCGKPWKAAISYKPKLLDVALGMGRDGFKDGKDGTDGWIQ